MKVHVLVGVDVVEGQTGGSKGRELCSNFCLELAANSREQEESDPGSSHVRIECCIAPNQSGNLDIGQDRTAIHQNQMQTHAKLGQPAGARHRIGGSISRNHQARGGEDPVPIRLLDRLVDSRVETEIVSADDQLPQLVISRLRKN